MDLLPAARQDAASAVLVRGPPWRHGGGSTGVLGRLACPFTVRAEYREQIGREVWQITGGSLGYSDQSNSVG